MLLSHVVHLLCGGFGFHFGESNGTEMIGLDRLQNSMLSAKVKELDTARAASEDLILSLSAEKTRMLGSSGEASDTIESLVDEYSRLVSQAARRSRHSTFGICRQAFGHARR